MTLRLTARAALLAVSALLIVPAAASAGTAPHQQYIDLDTHADQAYGNAGLTVTHDGGGYRLRGNLSNLSTPWKGGEGDSDDCVQLNAEEMYLGVGTTGNVVASTCTPGGILHFDRHTDHGAVTLNVMDHRTHNGTHSRIVTLTG